MPRILAANNLVIETQPDRWQLLVNANSPDHPADEERLLVEARPGQPLRYSTGFARRRRLPEAGRLPADLIQRVVLGWSAEDEAWHLGLLLGPELATARGSRWCALAQWPDPDDGVFQDIAQDARQRAAAAVLPDLPLSLDQWQLEATPTGWLRLARTGNYNRQRTLRGIWYLFCAVIYIVLAAATLRAGIALPRPEVLPYIGLATALILIGIAVYIFVSTRRQPTALVVDPTTHQIWAANGKGTKPQWRKSRAEVDGVYVSQVVSSKRQQPQVEYSELNLRLTDGKYQFLLKQEQPLERLAVGLAPGDQTVTPLYSDGVVTPAQAAGVYLARALGVPCWYDQRGR